MDRSPPRPGRDRSPPRPINPNSHPARDVSPPRPPRPTRTDSPPRPQSIHRQHGSLPRPSNLHSTEMNHSPPRPSRSNKDSPPRPNNRVDHSPPRPSRVDNSPPRPSHRQDMSPPRPVRVQPIERSPPRPNHLSPNHSPPRPSRSEHSPPRPTRMNMSPPRPSRDDYRSDIDQRGHVDSSTIGQGRASDDNHSTSHHHHNTDTTTMPQSTSNDKPVPDLWAQASRLAGHARYRTDAAKRARRQASEQAEEGPAKHLDPLYLAHVSAKKEKIQLADEKARVEKLLLEQQQWELYQAALASGDVAQARQFEDQQKLKQQLLQQNLDSHIRIKALQVYPIQLRDPSTGNLMRMVKRPTYSGPKNYTNRFNIPPGYRWDGVDRSVNAYNKQRELQKK